MALLEATSIGNATQERYCIAWSDSGIGGWNQVLNPYVAVVDAALNSYSSRYVAAITTIL